MAARRNPAEPDAAINPFTEEHYQLCNTLLASHAQSSDFFARCKAAGYQVDDLIAESDAYANLARGTKAQFFSRRP